MIRFFVGGIPKSMSVGKSVRVANASGGVRQFQTRAHTDWATLVGHVGRQHAPSTPIADAGLALTIVFWMPRPARAPKRVRLPLKRPDLDNLFHKITDQWNGVLWADDSQIVDVVIRKRFTRDGRTGAEFLIEPAGGALAE